MAHSLSVLYEDRDLLLIDKPAGVATMGSRKGVCLMDKVREYLVATRSSCFVGMVGRLDAPVTGILPVALNPQTAHVLSEQMRLGTARKIYRAVVDPAPPAAHEVIAHWLVSDKRRRKVHVVEPDTPGARRATLTYRVLAHKATASIVEVELHTGRKHQIRVQLAQHGCPILGDRKYGGRPLHFDPVPGRSAIALHASGLRLSYPTGYTTAFAAPLPSWWGDACR